MAGKRRLPLPQGNFFYLLASLLLLFLLFPLAHGSVLGVRLLDIMLSAILLSGIYAVSHKKQLFIVALVLALPTLAIHWSKYFLGDPFAFFAVESMTALFFIFTASIILVHVFRGDEVTTNKIAGAICVYLLIGLTWGICFALIEDLQPGSFMIGHRRMEEKVPQMMYYSFVNLTTLGYGDIIPLAPLARTLSILEAIIGQIYLVVLVARLVGLHIVHSTRKHSD